MSNIDIKEICKELGLTHAEMAEMLGYRGGNQTKKSIIQKIHNGTNNLTQPHLRLLKAYLSGYRPDDWPK